MDTKPKYRQTLSTLGCLSTLTMAALFAIGCVDVNAMPDGAIDSTDAGVDPSALSCDPGLYDDGAQCVPLTTCAAGTFVSAEATATADRVCAACPPGTLSTTTNAASCRLPIFADGQNASMVIGQSGFDTVLENQGGDVGAGTLLNPHGNVAIGPTGSVYINDQANHRILVYETLPAIGGAAANFAIGQLNLTSAVAGAGDTQLAHPYGVAIDGSTMAVAQWTASQVALYDPAPTSGPGTKNVILGSGTNGCTAGEQKQPSAVSVGGGKLVVADTIHHRVLIWDSIPMVNGTLPNRVLGQGAFTACSTNQGGDPDGSTLNQPTGVWTDGVRLVVLDSLNHRVLLWNTFPTSDGQGADLVLGQTDFTKAASNGGASASPSTISGPWGGAYFSGAQLFITDSSNHRVLIWDGWPTENGQPADHVLGQADFETTASAPGRGGLDFPTGVMLTQDLHLIVTDTYNNRVLVYESQ